MAQGTVSYRLSELHFDLVNFGTNVSVSATIVKYIVDDQANPQIIGTYPGQLVVSASALGPLTMAQVKAQAIGTLQGQYPALQGQTIS